MLIMALKSGIFSVFVASFFFQSNYGCFASSLNDCGVKLDAVDVNAAESPIILKYPQDTNKPFYSSIGSGVYSPEIFHPAYLEGDCLVRNIWVGGGLAGLTCLNHHLQFPGLENWPDNVRATSLIGGRQGVNSDNFTVFTPEHPSPILFEKMSGPVKCSGAVEPTMKKMSNKKYIFGYQMNALDFLPIYSITFMDQLTVARAKLLSTINRRPRIDEKNETLRKGQIYENMPFATSQSGFLGEKSELPLKLKEMLKKKYSADNTIADNYLVHGQLLSKDDLFYIPEQRATFFFENTDLIWNSINEGNWKEVGDIVRKLAYETFTDLDVYAGTLECVTAEETPTSWHRQSKNFTKNTCVPKFFFKLAVDTKHSSERGIVFITINDPSFKLDDDGSIPDDYKFCDKKPECHQLYPQFSSTKKGYTYCCDLKDFVPWSEISRSFVVPGYQSNYRQPSFDSGFGGASFAAAAGPPVPAPPPPPIKVTQWHPSSKKSE